MNNPPFQLPGFSRETSPTRRLLEETKLSRLPPISRRAVCEHCKGHLETDSEFQNAVKLCRECLRVYANIGTILDRHTDSKIRRNFREGKD